MQKLLFPGAGVLSFQKEWYINVKQLLLKGENVILSDEFICAGEKYSSLRRKAPAPRFCRYITIDKPPSRAEVTVCGLGFYELFLDGKRITKSCLASFITNSDDVVFYDNYDITDLLTKAQRSILSYALTAPI